MSPTEFGALDAHEREFLEAASQEYNRQRNDEIENAT